MKTLTLNLTESETALLIEAMSELEQRWAMICASTEDEDIAADYGNDLIRARLLLKSLTEQAVAQFGAHVLEVAREPIKSYVR
ncbi:hypothetical protein HZU77_007320 [Neisseriaceae bacterium TC5R-5]|nr:hypothetical protein [Neisseriaceae bacterium TC5R-5]